VARVKLVRSPRPPQTNRFSLPSFVIRGFLSSEHGGRRANPLFSIVWYSLPTVQELYCYAIGLCFVAGPLFSDALWTRKWLVSDMHGSRRATKIGPARSPGGGPPAAATFSKRRSLARSPTGPSWRR